MTRRSSATAFTDPGSFELIGVYRNGKTVVLETHRTLAACMELRKCLLREPQFRSIWVAPMLPGILTAPTENPAG